MAESATSTDIPGYVEQVCGPVRARYMRDASNDITTDLGVDQPGAPAQSRIKQKRKNSDPLPDLTKDQRVVLYTLLLCFGDQCGFQMDNDVTMGDINVRRTLSELAKIGLVQCYHAIGPFYVLLCIERYADIMTSYRQKCLLSDIDKDFYIQVASNESLGIYGDVYISQSTDTEQPKDNPITSMRLVVEGRAKDIVKYCRGTRVLISYFKVKKLHPLRNYIYTCSMLKEYSQT